MKALMAYTLARDAKYLGLRLYRNAAENGIVVMMVRSFGLSSYFQRQLEQQLKGKQFQEIG
jgi:hypothetical protein